MNERRLADADLAALVPDWIDWAEAARQLGVTVGKVRTMIREHELAAAVPTPGAGQQVPALFIQDGLLRHTYSFMGVETYRQVSDRPVAPGRHTLRLDFAADSATMAPPGLVTLSIDGETVGGGRMPHTVPIMFNGYSGLDVGRDNGEVVDASYEHLAPFPFGGEIHRVDFDVRQPGEESPLHATEAAARHARHFES